MSANNGDDDHQRHTLATLTIVHEYIVPHDGRTERIIDTENQFHFTQNDRLVTLGRYVTASSDTTQQQQQHLSVPICPPHDFPAPEVKKKRGRQKKPVIQTIIPRDIAISKEHCSVMFDPLKQVFVIINYGKNGTWINESLFLSNVDSSIIPSVTELKHNDLIRLVSPKSSTFIKFELIDPTLLSNIGTR
jgi:hypothetical protein